jgi:enoyl-[acyl-carrier protein] reductase I
MSKGILDGKTGVVFGVANKRSIAWAIAKAWKEAGANLIFNYQGERVKENVEELVAEFGANVPVYPCDVSKDEEIAAFFDKVKGHTKKLDLLLHSVAFAPKEALEGDFVSTSRSAFSTAMDISAYSLVALSRAAAPMMTDGGSVVAMSYLGSVKVVPHYNVMGVAKAGLEASVKYLAEDLGKDGIRVNAISAGPIKTLAASGIGDFRYIMRWNELNSPLRRNVTQDEVGKAALYLLSDLGSGTTGENLHVDAGYHVVGMKAVDAPDIDVVTAKAQKGEA